MIFIIDDDPSFAALLARTCRKHHSGPIHTFPDALSAIQKLAELETSLANLHPATKASSISPPVDLIFLDILLTGPDGFTLLHELVSYENTAKIPVVLVTSLDLATDDLSDYGVVKILNKATFTPADIKALLSEFIHA